MAGVPVGVTQGAFLLGSGGGILAVAVFTIATLAASRHSVIDAPQTGAPAAHGVLPHRYYLDLVLLAVIGLLWWQLQSRGSFLSQSVGSRELQIDESLLLGPVFGLLAAGLIIMRVFPWAAALLSRLVGPLGPSWLVHALRHVARAPMIPGILIVLLTLATALGVMGSAFSATLERSQRERALYSAGADLRLLHNGVDQAKSAEGVAAVVLATEIEGVAEAAEVFRTNAHITTTGFSTSTGLLAVDASKIDQVAWYREDFARGLSLSELAGLLSTGTANDHRDGIAVPADATGLGLWVRPGPGASAVRLWPGSGIRPASTVTSGSGKWTTRVGGGWTGELLDRASPGQVIGSRSRVVLSPPYTLMSFFVSGYFGVSQPGTFFLGRLDALTPGGEIPLADFQTTDGWEVIEDFARAGPLCLGDEPRGCQRGVRAVQPLQLGDGRSGPAGLAGRRSGGPPAVGGEPCVPGSGRRRCWRRSGNGDVHLLVAISGGRCGRLLPHSGPWRWPVRGRGPSGVLAAGQRL